MALCRGAPREAGQGEEAALFRFAHTANILTQTKGRLSPFLRVSPGVRMGVGCHSRCLRLWSPRHSCTPVNNTHPLRAFPTGKGRGHYGKPRAQVKCSVLRLLSVVLIKPHGQKQPTDKSVSAAFRFQKGESIMVRESWQQEARAGSWQMMSSAANRKQRVNWK